MMRDCPVAGVLLCAALVISGCGPSTAPVATLDAEPAGLDLSYPGFVSLNMKWEMLDELGPEAAHPQVFVHMLGDAFTGIVG